MQLIHIGLNFQQNGAILLATAEQGMDKIETIDILIFTRLRKQLEAKQCI